MTLIFSYVSSVTGLFAVSDTLVSEPAVGPPKSARIPFLDKPLQHVSFGYAPVGLAQKTVIFGRTMVQWAGKAIVARTLLSRFVQASENGEKQIKLREIIESSGCLKSELATVSLIYHYWSSEQTIARELWNCEYSLEGSAGGRLFADGTGFGYFFENLNSSFSGLGPYDEVLAEFLTKIVSHSEFEATGTDSLDWLYGGWFEITYKSDRTFSKVPYAIKFWGRNEHSLGSGGPTYFGWYSGSNLLISKVHFTEIDGVRQEHQHHIPVADFLGRDRITPPKNPIRPFFIAHVVYDEVERSSYHYVDTTPETEQMIVEASEKGLRLAWTNELRWRLFNLGREKGEKAPGVGALSRTWDPPPE